MPIMRSSRSTRVENERRKRKVPVATIFRSLSLSMFDTSNFSANEFIILSVEKRTAYIISRVTSPQCRAFRVIPSRRSVSQFPYFLLVEKCLFHRARKGREEETDSLRFST